MPSATAREFQRVARRLGFLGTSSNRKPRALESSDGRAVTIPLHQGPEIGLPLFHKLLRQLGVSLAELEQLR